MGEFSIWHWLIVLAVVLLLFGGNRISGLMGDLASGIKAFKKNMADDPDKTAPPRLQTAEPAPMPGQTTAAATEQVPG